MNSVNSFALRVSALTAAILLAGCTSRLPGKTPGPGPAVVGNANGAKSAITLRDAQDEAGITFVHTDGGTGRHYFIEQIGAGCAFIDYDNDGQLDVFAVNGAPLPGMKVNNAPHSALYHNLGRGKFEDVTEKAGFAGTFYGHGVCAGDFDNDGFTDLFITCTGHNRLYRNMGNGTFRDIAGTAGLADDEGIHTSACFVDYDNDGLLDLYVCRYVGWTLEGDRWCGTRAAHKSYCGPEVYPARRDVLYHNDGGGKFTETAAKAGVVQSRSKSLGVVATDINGDGWQDLYVACDLEPNLLFVNTGHGTFEEKGVSAGVAFSGDGASEAGMGVTAGDYDNDGRTDLFVTNYSFEMFGLYRNEDGSFFSYQSGKSGIGPPTLIPLGFGTRFVDLDNDGWADVVVADGHVLDDAKEQNQALEYAQTIQVFRNDAGQFKEVTQQSGPAGKPKYIGRGLAAGDFDNDGLVDLLINNNKGPLRLVRNETRSPGNWITLHLVGAQCNRSAIGASVTVKTASGSQVKEVVSGSSFLSQSDLRLHFGLGSATTTTEVIVRWPGANHKPGITETWRNLQPGRIHRLIQGSSSKEGGNRS